MIRNQKYRWLIGLFVLLGVAQSQASIPQPSPAALRGVDAVRAMELANAWGIQGAPVQSFVTPQAVNFRFPNGQTLQVALPADRMLVSIAPYISRTHPCVVHFMSGCRGEMVQVPVRVVVTNQNGQAVLSQTLRTLENGFLDLWLPRNQTYQIRLEARGRSVSGQISTFNDSDTCITTLRLR
jgi:hypothetical protein